MEEKDTKIPKRIMMQIIIFYLGLLFFLYNYIGAVSRYELTYYRDFLSTFIDISKPNIEYDFNIRHFIPASTYSINIQIPALSAVQEMNGYEKRFEIAKTLNFKLKVILKNDNQEIFNEDFVVDRDNYPTFHKYYSYNKGQNPVFNLKIKVIEPEVKEQSSIAYVKAYAFSKGADLEKRGYTFLMIILGILLLVSVLELVVKVKII